MSYGSASIQEGFEHWIIKFSSSSDPADMAQVEYAYHKMALACFNVFAHNRDDHSKNFSFIMDEEGTWNFTPAYDLTFSYSRHGHHSTMVAGESLSPGREHLLELSEHFGVNRAGEILEQVRDTIAGWTGFAKDAGVSKSSLNRIKAVLNV